jgi:hypothetical protein
VTFTKPNKKGQAKFRGKRWPTERQRKPFYPNDLFLDELRRIFREHQMLSRGERKLGLQICEEFAHLRKGDVHPGAEKLAAGCGLHRNWVNRCLAKFEYLGLLETYTPRWNKRNGGRDGATVIYFPVKMVQQSLQTRGILLIKRSAKETAKTKPYQKWCTLF